MHILTFHVHYLYDSKAKFGKLRRVQSGQLTALLEYLTVLLEFFDLFQSQWQVTASIWEGPGFVRPALGYDIEKSKKIYYYKLL